MSRAYVPEAGSTPDAMIDVAATPMYRWTILVVLWVTYVVVFLSRLSVGPLAPFFKADLHLDNTRVGLLLSAAAFGYTLTQLPAGWVVDRIGARWPIAVGEFVAAICMMAIALSSTYASLLTLMLLTGMGCGLLMPATTQAVVVWFPSRQRATVMGVKQTAVNMGGIIGAATLPVIAVAYGWRMSFVVVGGVALIVGLASLALYRNPPTIPGVASRPPTYLDLQRLLKHRDLWLVAGAGSCMNWIEMAIIAHFAVYLKERMGMTAVAAGGVLAALESAGAICRPGSGIVSDWLFRGARRPVFLILASMATGFLLLMAAAGPQLRGFIDPVAFGLGIGAVGFGAIFFTMLSEIGGRSGAGTAAAFGSTVSMIGSIVGPPAFGWIADVTHSYRLAWTSLGIVGVLAVILLLFAKEPARDEKGVSNGS